MSDSTYKRYMLNLMEADEAPVNDPPPEEEPVDDMGGGDMGGGDDMGDDSEDGDGAADNKEPSGLDDPNSINYKANKSRLEVFGPYLDRIAQDYNIEFDPALKGAISKLCLQIWNTAYMKASSDVTGNSIANTGYTGYKSNI